MSVFNLNLLMENVLMKQSEEINLDRDIFIGNVELSEYVITSDSYNIFTQFNLCSKVLSHGFKIHISATLENYQNILDIAAMYLIKKGINFKYVSNKKYLAYLLSDKVDRASAGKFITIYPSDYMVFITTVRKLYELLNQFNGQKILTDRSYKNSVVQYRFGSFVKDNRIKLKSGTVFIDDRRPIYSLPKEINEPFEEKKLESKYIGIKYKVFKAIQQKVSGGVYLARMNNNNIVLLKEARKDVNYFNGKDAVYYKNKECDFLKANSNPLFPKYIDDFLDCGHYFLVEEYIRGYSLSEFKSTNLASIANLKIVINNILKAVKYFHENNYFIMDISDKNIIVNQELDVVFIDLEHVTKVDDNFQYIDIYRTSGFYDKSIKDFDWKRQDYHQIGYLILSLFSRSNMLLNIDDTGEYTRTFFLKSAVSLSIPSEILNLILDLIFGKYEYITCYTLNNKKALENYSFKEYSIQDLISTAERHLKSNVVYSSYPEYVMKSNELYGKSGVEKILLNNKFCLEDIIKENNFYCSMDILNRKINDNNFGLENGVANIYINLILGNVNNYHLFKAAESSLIMYLKNVNFEKGDNTGLYNGYLSVLYALSFNEELVKSKEVKNIITNFIDKFISICINSSFFKNTQIITIGNKQYSSYLSNGIAGFLKTLIRLNKILNNTVYNGLIESITNDLLNISYTQNSTYATGMAGIIDSLIDSYEYIPTEKVFTAISLKIDELRDYIITYDNEFYIPSHRLVNLGLDYSSGSAGVIAVYKRFINLQEKEGYYEDF